jgi:hypothetical protein
VRRYFFKTGRRSSAPLNAAPGRSTGRGWRRWAARQEQDGQAPAPHAADSLGFDPVSVFDSPPDFESAPPVPASPSAFFSAEACLAAGLDPLCLKSVAYQPEPLSWNPAAVSCFLNVALPHSGQVVSTGSLTFCRYSFWNPHAPHRYS